MRRSRMRWAMSVIAPWCLGMGVLISITADAGQNGSLGGSLAALSSRAASQPDELVPAQTLALTGNFGDYGMRDAPLPCRSASIPARRMISRPQPTRSSRAPTSSRTPAPSRSSTDPQGRPGDRASPDLRQRAAPSRRSRAPAEALPDRPARRCDAGRRLLGAGRGRSARRGHRLRAVGRGGGPAGRRGHHPACGAHHLHAAGRPQGAACAGRHAAGLARRGAVLDDAGRCRRHAGHRDLRAGQGEADPERLAGGPRPRTPRSCRGHPGAPITPRCSSANAARASASAWPRRSISNRAASRTRARRRWRRSSSTAPPPGLYPASICGVVYQNRTHYKACQFSFACEGKSLRITEQDSWRKAVSIADAVVEGRTYVSDVGGATHYHANYVRPGWARRLVKMDVIGHHVFYKLKAGQT